jgi:hypothetical protein
MVGTIAPLVKAAKWTWVWSFVLHTIGGVAAGGLLGFVLGALGSIVLGARDPGSLLLGACMLALLAGLADVSGLGHPPSRRASVPQSWVNRWGPVRSAAVYGSVLGVGLTTVVPYWAFYWLLAWAFLNAEPGYGFALLAAYAGGRTAIVAAFSPVAARTNDSLEVITWIQERKGLFALPVGLGVFVWGAFGLLASH